MQPLRVIENILYAFVLARCGTVVLSIVFKGRLILGRVVRLGCFRVAYIDPGKLAEPHRIKPGANQWKPLQGVGLHLKRGYFIVNLINENQPGLVMLRPLEGEAVSALLCQRLFANIQREFQALDFHSKLTQFGHGFLKRCVCSCAVLFCHPPLCPLHPLTAYLAQTLPCGCFMQQTVGGVNVAPG